MHLFYGFVFLLLIGSICLLLGTTAIRERESDHLSQHTNYSYKGTRVFSLNKKRHFKLSLIFSNLML